MANRLYKRYFYATGSRITCMGMIIIQRVFKLQSGHEYKKSIKGEITQKVIKRVLPFCVRDTLP